MQSINITPPGWKRHDHMTLKVTFSPYLFIAFSVLAILAFVAKTHLWQSTPLQGVPVYTKRSGPLEREFVTASLVHFSPSWNSLGGTKTFVLRN